MNDLVGCAENLKGETVTEEDLRKWADDPNRMMECMFCGIAEPPAYFRLPITQAIFGRKEGNWITCRPRCREYKGVLPHIPGWSDLE